MVDRLAVAATRALGFIRKTKGNDEKPVEKDQLDIDGLIKKLEKLPELKNKEELKEIQEEIDKVKKKLDALMQIAFPEKKDREKIQEKTDKFFELLPRMGKKDAIKVLDTFKKTLEGKAIPKDEKGDFELKIDTTKPYGFDEKAKTVKLVDDKAKLTDDVKQEASRLNAVLDSIQKKDNIKFLKAVKTSTEKVTLPEKELKSFGGSRLGEIFVLPAPGEDIKLPKSDLGKSGVPRLIYLPFGEYKVIGVEHNKDSKHFVVKYSLTANGEPVGKVGKLYIPQNESFVIASKRDLVSPDEGGLKAKYFKSDDAVVVPGIAEK